MVQPRDVDAAEGKWLHRLIHSSLFDGQRFRSAPVHRGGHTNLPTTHQVNDPHTEHSHLETAQQKLSHHRRRQRQEAESQRGRSHAQPMQEAKEQRGERQRDDEDEAAQGVA